MNAAALVLAVTVTAYVPHQDVGAAGLPVLDGLTCAVSRDMDHLVGRWVYLDGYGWRFVNDRTHRRFKRRVDVAMNCKTEALEHGLKKSVLRGAP